MKKNPQLSPNLSAIFLANLNYFRAPKNLVEKLHIGYYALQYFHFCQNFEITIFAKFLNEFSTFLKFLKIFKH